MPIETFNTTLAIWIKELDRYHLQQLCAKPSAKSWSLGQLYLHLLADTHFFIDQIRICISTNDHENDTSSPMAKMMFRNNDFPDEQLSGAPSNSLIPQPTSKEELITQLENLKTEMNEIVPLFRSGPN